MAAALGKTGHPVRGHENGGLSDRRFRRPIVPWDAYFIVVFTLSAATATRELIGSATSPKIFTIVSLIFDASAISESNCVLAKSFCSRSEEHTSELQSLMRISYAVFCL